jgi:hypothetical protein
MSCALLLLATERQGRGSSISASDESTTPDQNRRKSRTTRSAGAATRGRRAARNGDADKRAAEGTMCGLLLTNGNEREWFAGQDQLNSVEL